MSAVLAVCFAVSAAWAVSIAAATPVEAQATCRAKCSEEEQACLARTNNKGQCGGRAQQCTAKCK